MHVAKEILDLEAWREFHGWEKEGELIELTADFDIDRLLLKIYAGGALFELDCSRKFNLAQLYDRCRGSYRSACYVDTCEYSE